VGLNSALPSLPISAAELAAIATLPHNNKDRKRTIYLRFIKFL
jgi:hypothetical protein